MRPAQLRRFADVVHPGLTPGQLGASMRPAQLRRFAVGGRIANPLAHFGFNEAGAAAPVCRRKRGMRKQMKFELQ